MKNLYILLTLLLLLTAISCDKSNPSQEQNNETDSSATDSITADTNTYYQLGLQKAMALWNTATSSDFLASEMGSLNGSSEQNLERIATQRWIANYTNGYEAWAIVRDT